MPLLTPSLDQAIRSTRVVDASQAFRAVIVRSSDGACGVPIRDLTAIERFLEEQALPGAEGESELRYVNLGMLASWLDSTIGDAELAGEVRSLGNFRLPFQSVAQTVIALLQIRLHQCRKVLMSEVPLQIDAPGSTAVHDFARTTPSEASISRSA